mgnify:FL=1
MLFYSLFTDNNTLLFTYMFVYNMSLVALFWTLFNTITTSLKTLQSFTGFSFNSFFVTTITILIFSMAGVPPFVGFFTKLFILTLITNNSFTLFYTLFFVTMFIGLYFYIQNIKFLHSTNQRSLNYAYLNSNERLVPVFFYFLTLMLTVIILGILTIEDILLIFSWLLA